jgi:hypothetical protein
LSKDLTTEVYLLYTYDPKMATLPDRLWRRVIELFLVAKKMNTAGHLPDTRQIAWLLRMSADDLEQDLSQITTTGIIVREVNGWFIPNFVKRQAAVPGAERKAQERNRKKSQQYNEDVTDASRSVTQSTENRLTEYRLTDNREQNTETEQSAPLDPFGTVQGWLEELTGVMPAGEAGVKAINQIVELKATRADVKAGCEWYKDNSGQIRYYSSLVGPIRTAVAKRTQQELSRPPDNGKPKKYAPVTLPSGEVQFEEVEE